MSLLTKGLLSGVDALTSVRHRPRSIIFSGYEPYAKICVPAAIQLLDQTRRRAQLSGLAIFSATQLLPSGLFPYRKRQVIADAPKEINKFVGEYYQDSSVTFPYRDALRVNTPFPDGEMHLNQAEDVGFYMTRVIITGYGGQPEIQSYDPDNPPPEMIIISFDNPWVVYDGVFMRESTMRYFMAGEFSWVDPTAIRGNFPITTPVKLRTAEALNGIMEIQTPYGVVPFEQKNLILDGQDVQYGKIKLSVPSFRDETLPILTFGVQDSEDTFELYAVSDWTMAYLPSGSMMTATVTGSFERVVIHTMKPQLNVLTYLYSRLVHSED